MKFDCKSDLKRFRRLRDGQDYKSFRILQNSQDFDFNSSFKENLLILLFFVIMIFEFKIPKIRILILNVRSTTVLKFDYKSDYKTVKFQGMDRIYPQNFDFDFKLSFKNNLLLCIKIFFSYEIVRCNDFGIQDLLSIFILNPFSTEI